MLQLLVVLSISESHFGTGENSVHTKEIYLLLKDMNDYHFEDQTRCSSPILHLINHYIIMLTTYLNH